MGYREEKEHIERVKLNKLKKELPDYMGHFFTGIDSNTAIRTRVAYAMDLKNFLLYEKQTNPTYLRMELNQIPIDLFENVTPFDIEEYLDYLSDYSPTDDEKCRRFNNKEAKQRKLSALRAFYKYCNRNGLIKNNPTIQVESPKIEEKNIIILDDDERKAFMDVVLTGEGMGERQKKYHEKVAIRDFTLFTLLLGTGMRVSELVGININDVNLKKQQIAVVRKGGDEAYIFMGNEVTGILKDYMETDRDRYIKDCPDEQALFLSMKNQRLSIRQIEEMTKKYAAIALPHKKGKVTPHKMRSTFATNAYNLTADAGLVANMLGHSSPAITLKRYAKMDTKRVEDVANKISKMLDE